MAPPKQFRSVCYTIFHPDEQKDDPSTYKTDVWDFVHPTHLDGHEVVVYSVYQWEQTPTTRRIHIQGFCKLNKRLRLSQIKRMFQCNSMHIEERFAMGSDKAAADYCKKTDTRFRPDLEPVEHGDLNTADHQGKRNDIESAYEAIKTGMPMDQLRDNFTGVVAKYPRFVADAVAHQEKKRYREQLDGDGFPPVEVIVYHGDTNVGKTYRVWNEVKERYGSIGAVMKIELTNTGVWFCNYTGQPAIFFDEFSSDWFKGSSGVRRNQFLNWLDSPPVDLSRKTLSTIPKQWQCVWITSNEPPEEWIDRASYKSQQMFDRTVAALRRRITTEVEMTRRGHGIIHKLNGLVTPETHKKETKL